MIGTLVQLATSTDGSEGFVEVAGGTANSLNSSLVLDGSGNDIFVQSALWKVGMTVLVDDNSNPAIAATITAVTPNTPTTGIYKLTTNQTMSPYLVANNATVVRTSVLAFSSEAAQGVDGYKRYTGLLELVQKTIDGIESDPAYPGIKAAGVQIEVLPPIVLQTRFELDLTLAQGVTISSILDDVKNAVSTYVNSSKVGEEIILNQIVERVMAISGVDDMRITYPLNNITVATNEIARVSDNQIIVG